MNEARPDDRELESYLLGLLPEEDTERLDELSIVDDEIASRLRLVEDDLVDAYVSGELAGDMKARFESVYVLTERRRQKVRFARTLLAVGRDAGPADSNDHKNEPGPASAPARSTPPRRLVRVSKVIWTLGIAATVLLLAGGALVSQNARLRSDLGEAQRAGGQLLIRTQDLERRLDERPVAAAAPPSLPAVALVLVPQTRALAGPIATLVVPEGADRVALELRTDPNDASRYKVMLTDPATDRVVWRSETLAARVVDQVPMIGINIPAALLKTQHYAIELDGVDRAGHQDIVGSYTFEVVRR